MSLIDQINARGESSDWRKLTAEGDKVVGTLLDATERQRYYDGAPVPSRTTGRPRMEWVLTIREPTGSTVKVAANESMQEAIHTAVRQGSRLAIGSQIGIEVTVSAPSQGQAKYRAEIGPVQSASLLDGAS